MSRIALIVLFVASGCAPSAPAIPTTKTADRIYWPFSGHPEGFYSIQPSSMKITGGTTFTLNGVKCRLLGLKEPTDGKLRSEAIKYVENWIANCGSRIKIINSYEPLFIDGACVVWVTSTPHDFKSDLNKGLLFNQLVELDLEAFKDYQMIEFSKEDDKFEVDWRGYLRAAKEKKAIEAPTSQKLGNVRVSD